MRSGPTNPELKKLIVELRKGSAVWKKLADELGKPTRARREINLSRISRYSSENELVLVPGKVLSSGTIGANRTIAAWKFSREAVQKIQAAKSHAISLEEAMKKDSKSIRILG